MYKPFNITFISTRHFSHHCHNGYSKDREVAPNGITRAKYTLEKDCFAIQNTIGFVRGTASRKKRRSHGDRVNKSLVIRNNVAAG